MTTMCASGSSQIDETIAYIKHSNPVYCVAFSMDENTSSVRVLILKIRVEVSEMLRLRISQRKTGIRGRFPFISALYRLSPRNGARDRSEEQVTDKVVHVISRNSYSTGRFM